MGRGEMVYILEQRLNAQKIEQDKSMKVLEDVSFEDHVYYKASYTTVSNRKSVGVDAAQQRETVQKIFIIEPRKRVREDSGIKIYK